MTHRTRLLAGLAAASFLIAACGGDDDDTVTVETPAGDVEIDPGDVDTDALEAAGADGDLDFSEAVDALGLETKIDAMGVSIEFTDVDVSDDGKTAEVTIEDDNPMIVCMVAGSVLSEDETLIVHYDGGTETC